MNNNYDHSDLSMPILKKNESFNYRFDIQGLRAVAISIVVLGHAGVPGFTGGFIGVDIFFIISGYLITGLLVRQFQLSPRLDLPSFYAKRIQRLLPALLVVLLLTILMTSFFLTSNEATALSQSAPFAIVWASNIFFTLREQDYFKALENNDLFLHSWSLGVEEQFYLIWPMIIWVISVGIKKNKTTNFYPILIIFLVGLSSFVLSLYWIKYSPIWAYYMMPARIWQFAIGAMCFLLSQRSHNLYSILKIPSKSIGLFLIVICVFFYNDSITYPGFAALIPSFAAALILVGSDADQDWATQFLSSSVTVWFGNISYSLYLWHWPVLMMGSLFNLDKHPIGLSFLIVLSILLGWISYRLIELPFWKGGLKFTSNGRVILYSVLMMLLVAGSLVLVGAYYEGTGKRRPIDKQISTYRSDIPVLYKDGCDSWIDGAQIKPCIYGAIDSPKTVVLIGDSIGVQWFSFLPELYRSPEWRIIVLTKSACPMVDEEIFYDSVGGIYKVCSQWRNSALEYLKKLNPDIVFLGNSSTYDFDRAQWLEGSRRVIGHLSHSAKKIIIIPGIPSLSFYGPDCVERHYKYDDTSLEISPGDYCNEPKNTTAEGVLQYLLEAAKDFDNATVMDLSDLVCPNGICKSVDDSGIMIYRDKVHLTDTFVRSQAKVIQKMLQDDSF